jgi:hypothetical protein
MKLTDMFSVAIGHADKLALLHDRLTTGNKYAIQSKWAERFLRAKLTNWSKRDLLWRSKNDSILIVGTTEAGLSHRDFTSEALLHLLRAALVMSMAGVDKLLHEALSKHFVALVKKRKLDNLLVLELSKSYRISIESRVRKGKGGRVRSRPGHKLKAAVLDKLYRVSFLSLNQLQEICAACGKEKIFYMYGRTMSPQQSSDTLQKRWARIYMRRNHIAHECDIMRKSRARKVYFHPVTSADLKKDIEFVKSFGLFLAHELE